ncbi:DUF6443 domain-containing protein [Flavobacterium sp. N1736]|uniref:DUF6443 domain-containing protein n=1 Tax=Flavobacterium sp. N1736 TaxID=2986823 RepID=UPI00222455AA|nr:DUF6443 domain-containing protein [Flavobacterium sp. N1736]
MNSKNKYSHFGFLIFLIIILSLACNIPIFAQNSGNGQLTLSGDVNVNYGDRKIYTLQDLSNTDGNVGSNYNNFEWISDGDVLTPDSFNKKEVQIEWYSWGQKTIKVLYNRYGESEQFYAEFTVNVQANPATPEPPVILSSNCSQVVLQRSNPNLSNITWYWQSSSTGTSTSNSNTTITLTSGTEYFLRANANGNWGQASSVQYSLTPTAPVVGTITQPTSTVTTGSVELSNLPNDGVYIINPGNIMLAGSSRIITGLNPSTTYNFTVTNASGCTSPASANVVINGAPSSQLPTPTISGVVQPTCANNTGHFVITNYNPAYTYTAFPTLGATFSGANVTIQNARGNDYYISPTSYMIKASLGLSESYLSEKVDINTQIVTPAAPVISSVTQPSASSTGSVVLSGLPFYDSWTINPGNISGHGTTATINGLAASAKPYKFTITNSSGCTSAPSADVLINGFCGISNENYVHTIIPKIGSTSVSGLASDQKNESITYYDGIGRPIQTIDIKAGFKSDGTALDIIKHIEYDEFGRQIKEYLPYTDTFNCGAFRGNTLINLAIDEVYNTAKYENTLNPYSEKKFEASPLNRILKQAAPGEDWKLGNGHEIKLDYQTNADNEVKNFEVNFVLSNGIYTPELTNVGYYNSNELYKNIVYDENTSADPSEKDGSTVEFKNKQGQVVLKRTYGTVEKGTTNEEYNTYYVYDDFGNLSFVIPPKAVDLIDANTTTDANPISTAVIEPGNSLHIKAANSITLAVGFHAKTGSTFSAVIGSYSETVLDDLCYQYKYDQRNRLIEKKLPGKDWEYIIYDKLDRPILTQDANLRINKKWLFTKFDVFSRPVYTGEYTNAEKITRTDMQILVDAAAAVFETRQSVNTINGTTVYYSNNAFPNDANINLFTINYYDDYGFDTIPVTPPAPITNTKGLATGSKIRVLGKPDWITNWNYYDDKGRPVYSYSKNDYLNTTSSVKTELDFVGKVLQTTSTHSRNSITTTIVDAFTYDGAGRLTKQTQAINGTTTPEIIVANTYDELGQLTSKKVGGKTAQGLQTVDFKYNIRGWLKNINDVSAIGNDLFAFQINYNEIADINKKLFNGNISQTFWKTANQDTGLKNYTYTYDKLNRLTNAVDNLNKFNESLNYDKNGNITNLVRLGEIVGGVPLITNPSDFGTMDNLVYTYDGGNKLQIVSDSANDTYGFKDDFIGTGADTTTDYTYDGNGNMKTDTNKGITNITYNYLNLPTQVTIAGQNINYEYDATGVKQQKTANGIVTDYAGGFIYEGNQLKFFSQPEGYVAYNSGTFDYIYQYKDHLGNVRLSYDKNLAIQEENNYYPFGLKQKGYNNVNSITTGNSTAQRYKFQSEELQDELGLNTYAYGWRDYDPAIGRFNKIDRYTENYADVSPYSYITNNPVFFREIKGDSIRAVFYDIEGNRNKKIPKAVQKMFNEEFGIQIGYNADTEMLYFVGSVESELSQSADVTNSLTDALKDTNGGSDSDKYGRIEFGYNRRRRDGSGNVSLGVYSAGWTQIDLASFDSNGDDKNIRYSSALDHRAFNMARVFEHEYFGHFKTKTGAGADGGRFSMGSAVEISNVFSRQRNLPERLHYGDGYDNRIYFGKTLQYSSQGEQRKAVKEMVNKPGTNNLFIEMKK